LNSGDLSVKTDLGTPLATRMVVEPTKEKFETNTWHVDCHFVGLYLGNTGNRMGVLSGNSTVCHGQMACLIGSHG
jgi:hypothetical protein